MIDLPDVTLVAVDTVCEKLIAMAIRDCVQHVKFGDLILFTDKYNPDVPKTNQYIMPKPMRSIEDHDNFRWYSIPDLIKTSHMLIIEWDSWIIDPTEWNNIFLNYDYIGAPWPWHKEYRVGNGGFSLRSKDLMQYLKSHRSYYMKVHEDDTLCRIHRPNLERLGFAWGPEKYAERFAFERSAPRSSFGFHGLFNWPAVLKDHRLKERLDAINDYVRGKPEFPELIASLHSVRI